MKQSHPLSAALSLLICCSDVAGQHGQSSRLRLTALPQQAAIVPGMVTLSRDASYIVIRDEQGLSFIDTEGKRRGQMQGNFLKVAVAATARPQPAGLVAALEKPEPAKEPSATHLLLHVFDVSATLATSRWAWPMPYGFDEPLPHFCFNLSASHLMLANPGRAILTFFSSRGELRQRHELFKEAPFSLERPLFLSAGETAFAVLSQLDATTPANRVSPVVGYFSSEGEEKWRRTLAPGTAGGLVVSADGRRLAACRYVVSSTGRVEANTVIFDQQGKRLAELPLLFRQARFAGDRLVLASRESADASWDIVFVESETGKILVDKKIAGEGEMIAALAVDENQNAIALVGRSEFARGGFQLADAALLGIAASGEEIFRSALDAPLRGTPALAYSELRRELVIAAEGMLQRFRLERVTR